MLAVPLFNMQGDRTGEVEVDPLALGGEVRPALIKQVIVAYQDHQRLFSARTKRRSDVEGSTKKLYRQKGTGHARAGMLRTPVRRGGGRAFAKRIPRSPKGLPKKMRRLACGSAVLAKIQSEDVLIVEGLELSRPQTKVLASMFSALEAKRGCLLALLEQDRNVYLSGRNLPGVDVREVGDLNAYEVLRRPKLIFTKPAFERFTAGRAGSRVTSS